MTALPTLDDIEAERARRRNAADDLLAFNWATFAGKYRPKGFHEHVVERLQAWANFETRHLIIVQPPRTGKSEHATRRLPAWLFGRNPREQVLMLAHTQALANSFSTDVRRIIRSQQYRTLFPQTRLPQSAGRSTARIGDGDEIATKAEWETVGYHGRFRAAGVGVGIVGGGYRRAITDDVFKSLEEAYSLAARDRVWGWYTNDVRSRLEYPFSELLVNTRWHKDDLIGRLLEHEGTVEQGGKWEVIHLPFLQDRAPVPYDQREPGAPLWPEWFLAPWEHLPDTPAPDVTHMPEAAEASEVTHDELVARAVQYFEDYKGDRDAVLQGRPVPEGGNIIKTEWMQQHWGRLPAGDVEWVIFCDPKGGSKDPKSSRAVIQLWCRSMREPAKLYLVGQARGLWNQPETIEAFEVLSGVAPWKWARLKLTENKADGKAIVATLKAVIPGMDEFKLAGGAKPVRYRGVQPYWRAGNIWLPPVSMCIDPLTGENWLDDFRTEHADAPGGVHDDQIDTSTMAITWFLVEQHEQDDGEKTWQDWANLLGG